MNERLLERLLGLQNPDGGWGATSGRPSNTEVTALASLALRPGVERDRGLEWLSGHQRPDGSWPWTEEVDASSWTTSHAVMALAHSGRHDDAVARGIEWVLGEEGQGFSWRYRLREWLTRSTSNDLDGTVKGWPWASGTFSWVEPTSFAVLALKTVFPGKRSRRAASRIREAETMILDRECPGGGWNYGNKRVLGVDQAPYPDTTALALLALQDRTGEPALERGLKLLDRTVPSTGSGLTLSMAVLCRRAYGLDTRDLLLQLDRSFDDTGFLNETRVTALAVLAGRDDAPLTLRSDD